jgi:hypothetical protein
MASQSQQFMTDLKVNMMTDTVDIRVTPSLNSYGERSFSGGATTYSAYVRRVEVADRTTDVDLQNVDYICYIPDASLTLDVDDELTLPAPISAVRPIVKVGTRKDPLGQVCVVAYVGRR